MVAFLTPFAATSNGFIFPHVTCSSAMHDLQHIGSDKQIFRLIKTLETGLSQKSEDLEKLISSLTFPQLVFDFTFLLFFSNLTSSIDQIFNFRCEIFKHGGTFDSFCSNI
jgi:hypothetical protein